MNSFHRGLIIVKPYGTYIRNRKKTLIIKTKNIESIINVNLLLIEDKIGLGIIVLGSPDKINLMQFKKLFPHHLITDTDRLNWWPKYATLYAYPIIKSRFFKKPILLNYPTGPQITVIPSNIIIKDIFTGMSGYHYKWMYPDSTRDYLEYYANYLNSVEINSSFYKLPTKASIQKSNFYNLTYSIKVSQYITHSKKLKNVRGAWNNFYRRFELLHDKIGCFLFQFSSSFSCNTKNFNRLEKLSDFLNATHNYAFEFRNASWYDNPNVTNLFRIHNWTLVIININDANSWADNLSNGFNPALSRYQLTSDCIYIRMHGTTGKYIGPYDNSDYNKIFKFIKKKSVNKVFIYFNNTDSSHALDNAISLSDKINILNKP